MTQKERRIFLIKELLKEKDEYKKIALPEKEEDQRLLLRGLMNLRMPGEISGVFLKIQDEYLKEEIKEKGITDIKDLEFTENGICIWQGDITTLRIDAIVNAANSGMTGCYVPNHNCIDNAIHSFSGIELRNKLSSIMKRQGHLEPTGKAKITEAFNLPSKFIIHTVGPIITGSLRKEDCEELASCYKSSLELASEKKLESIAFCCISTGEFHFPNEKAAEIAVFTVKEFLKKKTSIKKVIFNVFKEKDREIYRKLL